MYTDCHGGRPVGDNEDFDFAVVDAGGSRQIAEQPSRIVGKVESVTEPNV